MNTIIPLAAQHFDADDPILIDSEMLDRLMPLHIRVAVPGIITHVAPTLSKLLDQPDLIGRNCFDFIDVRRPTISQDWAGLTSAVELPLSMSFKGLEEHKLKGVCVPLRSHQEYLIDLSLGVGVCDIVAKNALKFKDFSPADPTAEMIYMVEAQSMLLRESRDLNNRLNGAKIVAEEQAFTDVLTGLNNRRALTSFLRRLLESKRGGAFAVMQLDLDLFKAVNDTFGHDAGDHVLKEVAGILLSETRSTDLVARVGGDEFVVIVCDYTDNQNLQEIADRIIEKVNIPIGFGAQSLKVGISIGVSLGQCGSDMDAGQLIKQADTALYAAKEAGRGTCRTFVSN